MLTENQIQLIEKSWSQVVPIQHLASSIFYIKVFSIDRSLKDILPQNLIIQKKKFVITLNLIVNRLDKLYSIIPMLEKITFQSSNYSDEVVLFQILGDGLKYTLKTCLGENYTFDVDEAWSTLLQIIIQNMIRGVSERRVMLSSSI